MFLVISGHTLLPRYLWHSNVMPFAYAVDNQMVYVAAIAEGVRF